MPCSIRFAAGSPQGPRSRTWGVVVDRKGEIYVFQRRFARFCKLSLHQTGALEHETGTRQFSFVNNQTAALAAQHYNISMASRHTVQLGPAPELSPGRRLLAQIVVPGSELIRQPYHGKKLIQWVAPPDEASAVEFAFLATDSPTEDPSAGVERARVLLSYPARDWTFWLIARAERMPDRFRKEVQRLKSVFPVPAGGSEGGVMVAGSKDPDRPLLIEIAPRA